MELLQVSFRVSFAQWFVLQSELVPAVLYEGLADRRSLLTEGACLENTAEDVCR